MKLKKVKALLTLANEISKKDIKDVHPKPTGQIFPDGTPLVLIPTKGKYLLKETVEISKIIKSIEPKDLITEAVKINAQAGVKLLSVYSITNMPNYRAVFFHTPFGMISYHATIDEETAPVEVPGEVTVEVDDHEIETMEELCQVL